MRREKIKQELNGYGFADIEDDLRLALLEEIDNGYVMVRWPEVQMYEDKCWFNKEAIAAAGGEVYFIPKKYL